MEKPSLTTQALARIEAVKLDAGADLLNGLDAFWRGIGMRTTALREHHPSELIPLFERFAEEQFAAEAREWLARFADPDAYSWQLAVLPATIATRFCPHAVVFPENVWAADWTDLYRTLKTRTTQFGRGSVSSDFGQPSGEWERYLDHSFSRRFLKAEIGSVTGGLKNFMLLFRLKYHFHLRLFANQQRFIRRVCTHLSVSLHTLRAEAYRRMADAVPPTSPELPEPADVVPAVTPRRRGPKPDYEMAQRVAAIIERTVPGGDWRSRLDEVCEALDDEHVPVPSTWRRNRNCRNWSLCLERDVVVKAIEYRLQQARQRKKGAPETFS
jgi:hypothetical protein